VKDFLLTLPGGAIKVLHGNRWFMDASVLIKDISDA
jgi:hypothetical protein